jgi:ferric iron reductase protein FhuF
VELPDTPDVTGLPDVPGLPAAQPLLPGSLLTEAGWLSARVDQIGRQVGCAEGRVNATLWWYSASLVLLGPAVHELMTSGAATDLTASSLWFTLGSAGYLERVVPGPTPIGTGGDVSPAEALGRHLDDVLGRIIAPLARVGPATERSLWAIAVDSLAGRVLAEARVSPAGPAAAGEIARVVAQAAPRLRPLPRFVDVRARPGGPARTYVHRVSCCLLLRIPAGICVSCPKQSPADRLDRLRRHG